jgi:hypothetical protein
MTNGMSKGATFGQRAFLTGCAVTDDWSALTATLDDVPAALADVGAAGSVGDLLSPHDDVAIDAVMKSTNVRCRERP